MLDVHVAVIEGAPQAWIQECLRSVREAALACRYAVGMHVFDGIRNHIGESRRIGYAKGTHPFVAYVDYDDYVLPAVFDCLATALAPQPAAVFTRELTWQNGQIRQGGSRHHLAVYRRDVLDGMAYEEWPACIDLAIKRTVEHRTDDIVDLDTAPYVHRLYVSEGRKLRRSRAEELRRAWHV